MLQRVGVLLQWVFGVGDGVRRVELPRWVVRKTCLSRSGGSAPGKVLAGWSCK